MEEAQKELSRQRDIDYDRKEKEKNEQHNQKMAFGHLYSSFILDQQKYL